MWKPILAKCYECKNPYWQNVINAINATINPIYQAIDFYFFRYLYLLYFFYFFYISYFFYFFNGLLWSSMSSMSPIVFYGLLWSSSLQSWEHWMLCILGFLLSEHTSGVSLIIFWSVLRCHILIKILWSNQ